MRTEFHAGENPLGDEAAYEICKWLQLKLLWASACHFGWETPILIAAGLPTVHTLNVNSNADLRLGSGAIGRLPQLTKLYARNRVSN